MLDYILRTNLGGLLRRTVGLAFDLPAKSIPTLGQQSRAIHQNIPAHLIQTWEVNSFGRRHRKSLMDMRSRNPEIVFELVLKESRDEFMAAFGDPEISELYFDTRFATMQVDLFRYSYLFQHGGYYCDISMNFLGNISSQHSSSASAVIAFENNLAPLTSPRDVAKRLSHPKNLMAIWLFGFTANHPILEILLDQIKKESPNFKGKVFDIPKSAILELTGPIAFTRAVWRYLELNVDKSIEFVGIDFNGSGRAHRGAGYRHIQFPSYAHARNEKLFY
jgi:mannosyltransferase OCH1-like enzyme